MKLIMENWRQYLHEEEMVQAKDLLKDIKIKLNYMAAKAAGKEALKQFVGIFGEAAAEVGMEFAKTIPGVGNVIAGLSGIWKTGKATAELALASKEVAEATNEVLKIAAGEYVVDFDDSQLGNNQLAKIFNIDDRIELVVDDAYLKNFAGLLVSYLKDNPELNVNPSSFADDALMNYLKQSDTKWSAAGAPNNPR